MRAGAVEPRAELRRHPPLEGEDLVEPRPRVLEDEGPAAAARHVRQQGRRRDPRHREPAVGLGLGPPLGGAGGGEALDEDRAVPRAPPQHRAALLPLHELEAGEGAQGLHVLPRPEHRAGRAVRVAHERRIRSRRSLVAWSLGSPTMAISAPISSAVARSGTVAGV